MRFFGSGAFNIPPLDPASFARPIAHRGLHGGASGAVENTAAAFAAAIAQGFGIECDIRPAAQGHPVVFHDASLDRLTDGAGLVSQASPAGLARVRHRGHGAPILAFSDMLDLAGGQTPLFAEIKSDWRGPNLDFLGVVARMAKAYKGPIALMSFDPDVMAAVAELAPAITRGAVSGNLAAETWWRPHFDAERAYRLTHLLEWSRARPSFVAYDVGALPTPVTRFVREALEMPLLAWTVRTENDWTIARTWADAAIFEGPIP